MFFLIFDTGYDKLTLMCERIHREREFLHCATSSFEAVKRCEVFTLSQSSLVVWFQLFPRWLESVCRWGPPRDYLSAHWRTTNVRLGCGTAKRCPDVPPLTLLWRPKNNAVLLRCIFWITNVTSGKRFYMRCLYLPILEFYVTHITDHIHADLCNVCFLCACHFFYSCRIIAVPHLMCLIYLH